MNNTHTHKLYCARSVLNTIHHLYNVVYCDEQNRIHAHYIIYYC